MAAKLAWDKGLNVVIHKRVVVEALGDIDWLSRVRHQLLQRQVLVAAFDPVDAITDGVKQRALARRPWCSVVWL